MIGTEQNGWRCRIGDEAGKRWASEQCTKVAKRYPGAIMLSDIDISTGEFVYRVELPENSYLAVAVAVKRRRRNGI